MEKEYPVSFEIAGPTAMFTRPDTGAVPVSYPAPTFSAARGMFEAVARFKSAYIRPTKVEICAPIRFHKYVTNYRGPLRESSTLSGSYQLVATVLVDVCYRVYGIVEGVTDAPHEFNHLHALQEVFLRRLGKGQCYYTPCLGWKEFVPSYFGPFRPETQVDEELKKTPITVPSMLFSVFVRPGTDERKVEFRQNIEIREGVLLYA
jgi:CRISPR-associated protein Cas5d